MSDDEGNLDDSETDESQLTGNISVSRKLINAMLETGMKKR